MGKRMILLLIVCMMGHAIYAQTSPKKPIRKVAKLGNKKKVITEHEAKALHEAKLAKEGKSGIRRAYKRSDFTNDHTTANIKSEPHVAEQPTVAVAPAAMPKAVMPPKKEVATPMPRFIESIVLDRSEGKVNER